MKKRERKSRDMDMELIASSYTAAIILILVLIILLCKKIHSLFLSPLFPGHVLISFAILSRIPPSYLVLGGAYRQEKLSKESKSKSNRVGKSGSVWFVLYIGMECWVFLESSSLCLCILLLD